MKTTIKRGGDIVTEIDISENSVHSKKLLGENIITLNFTLNTQIEFNIGDYIMAFGGEKFTLNQLPTIRKTSNRSYEYTGTFEGVEYELLKTQYLFLGEDNSLREADFSLMGNLATFGNLIVDNMNRVSFGWTLGTIDASEYKNLSFSKETCLAALQRLASEFSTEFYIVGNTINISKKQNDNGLIFEYGKNKGLYEITRTNRDSSNVVTRLYAFGSDKNLPSDYRNYTKRLKLPAPDLYLEKNVDRYGIMEHTEIFEDIYPHREGTVSSSNSITSIVDSSIDFNINHQLLEGITAKIVFNTGQLAGYQFDVNTYDDATKTITFNTSKDEKAYELPNQNLKPAVGDKYVLVDIKMPQTYIDNAEIALKQKAQAYLDLNCVPRVAYSVVCDPLYFKGRNIKKLYIGDSVTIKDDALGLHQSIRIISYKQYLFNNYQFEIELADTVNPSILVRLYQGQKDAQRVIELNNLMDVNRARRNWRDTQELHNMVFDSDGYFTDKIKPLSVDTRLLSVGAKSGNFVLNGVVFSPNNAGSKSSLIIGGGNLEHYAIEDNIRTWTMQGYSISNLIDGNAYYIYARCIKIGSQGTFVVSTTQKTVESEEGYYHFLVGILHSVYDNYREISLMYGTTLINGGSIRTGRIVSQDGGAEINLDNSLLNFPNAGIDGSVGGNNDKVRFYAGAGYNNRNSANFRVTQGGKLTANNADISGKITSTDADITGKVIAESGRIGNWTIDDNGFSSGESVMTKRQLIIANREDTIDGGALIINESKNPVARALTVVGSVQLNELRDMNGKNPINARLAYFLNIAGIAQVAIAFNDPDYS